MIESDTKAVVDLHPHHMTGLRRNALPFVETLAQSIANIAPTATPALTIPLVFANSGNGTWLTYLFATIGLALVSICINQFARRAATPGSIYSYTTQGLGKWAGFIAGWGLILAYLATGIAVVFGFSIFASNLLKDLGIDIPVYVLYVVDAVLIWLIAYKDIKLSTKLMLFLELASVSLILLLAVIVLGGKGLTLDTPQFSLDGVSLDGMRLGLVLAVFSYVGFESATALGAEAQRPLVNIPKAVIASTIMVGCFFIVMSYVEVTGFRGLDTPLNQSTEPLVALAKSNKVDFFGTLTSIGAMISFFACGLACVNAVARILFAMGRDGILHTHLGRSHSTNETPHIAATLSAISLLVVPVIFSLAGVAMLDAYGYTGTIATFGFLLAYILISIAAPVFLQRAKILKTRYVIVAVLAVLFMLVPLIGSVYPTPAEPYNYLPYIFAGYMLIGIAWLVIERRRSQAKKAAAE